MAEFPRAAPPSCDFCIETRGLKPPPRIKKKRRASRGKNPQGMPQGHAPGCQPRPPSCDFCVEARGKTPAVNKKKKRRASRGKNPQVAPQGHQPGARPREMVALALGGAPEKMPQGGSLGRELFSEGAVTPGLFARKKKRAKTSPKTEPYTSPREARARRKERKERNRGETERRVKITL